MLATMETLYITVICVGKMEHFHVGGYYLRVLSGKFVILLVLDALTDAQQTLYLIYSTGNARLFAEPSVYFTFCCYFNKGPDLISFVRWHTTTIKKHCIDHEQQTSFRLSSLDLRTRGSNFTSASTGIQTRNLSLPSKPRALE